MMIEAGNIDLANRPRVKNPDGSISTVRSLGVNIDNQEVLIPTVSEDGRIMSDDEAINTYIKTGRHLGKFKTPEESNAYAEVLHRSQEAMLDAPKVGGIAGLYTKEIGRSVAARLAHPSPEPEPSWSTWALTKALGGGLVSGGLEYSGSVADLASGAAAPMAATGGSAGGMFASQTDAERQQEEEARQRMLKGPAFDPTMGNVMRAKAGEFAPDPITAHKSAQILHGLSAGVGKAVGSAMTFGPVAGAIVFGAEEGNTAAQNLMVAGVDGETAAKVGAITAVASAVGAGLPVAGKTLAKTATLALTGGPGTYIAQEALSRKILADAGYNAQAEMHDPFDPVMLALSTVIPGAMGALAMRQAARAKARAKAAEPVRPEPTNKVEAEPAKVVPHDTDAIAARAAEDPAAVDAARVRVLDDAESKHIPPETPPGNEAGIGVVRDAVESGDMTPVVRMAAEQEVAQSLQMARGNNTFSGQAVDAGRGVGFAQSPDTPIGKLFSNFADIVATGRDQTGQGRSPEQRTSENLARLRDEMFTRANARKPEFANVPTEEVTVAATDGMTANVWATERGTTQVRFIGNDGGVVGAALMRKGMIDSIATTPGAAGRGLGKDMLVFLHDKGLANIHEVPDRSPGFVKAQKAARTEIEGRTDADPAATEANVATAAPKDVGHPETPGATEKAPDAETKPPTPEQEAARLSKEVQNLAEADPDTMVTLPGHDAPMKLSDAIELIDQQTKELLQQGDLVQAAATCAIMGGM